jgi:DNA-binding NarL/FixJ family response regulator
VDPSAPSVAAGPDPSREASTSVIVGSDSELRTLLRGLLRLRRFQIVGEAESGPVAEELLTRLRPTLLVVDSGLAGDLAADIVRWTRAHAPSTRVVLIGSRSEPATADPAERPHAIVPRPFRIREFEVAVDPQLPA